MNLLFIEGPEVLQAVLPVVGIVLLLHITLDAADRPAACPFSVSKAFCITTGLSVFLYAIDLSVNLIGRMMGRTFFKTDSLLLLAGAGLAWVSSFPSWSPTCTS